MLELFRRNLFFNSLLLFPYAVLVRIQSLLQADQPAYAADLSPFAQWVYSWVPSLWVQNLLACVLVFLQAAYINRIIVKHRMSGVMTLFPGLIYVLLCSLMPDYTYLSPVLIANSFLIAACSDVFKVYKKHDGAAYIFNSGVFLGIASLIYLPYLYIAIAVFVGLIILRSFKVKELLQYLIGLLTPFYLYFSWAYYRGELSESYSSIISNRIGWPSDIIHNGQMYFLVIFIGLLVGLAIISYSSYLAKKSIQAQKKIDILYWIMLFSAVALVSCNMMTFDHLLMLAFPMSVLLSMNLLRVNNPIVAELGHLATLAIIGLIHFGVIL